MKPVAQCRTCNKTITVAEIEVGSSLICERCAPKKGEEAKSDTESSDARRDAEGQNKK